MRRPGWKSGTLIFFIVFFAGALLRFSLASARYSRPLEDGDAQEYFAMGQSLKNESSLSLYGFAHSAFRGMLYPLWISRVPGRAPGAIRLAAALLGTTCLLLVFSLGRRVHSDLCGLVAMAIYALDYNQINAAASARIECFYGFLVLVVAISLVEWARSPDARGTIRLGLALGVSLLCRSTLFALPPLLAIWSYARAEKRLRSVKTSLLIVVMSYIVLIPWTIRNARYFGEFVPFERHVATYNIYMASLGYVNAVGRDETLAAARRSNAGFSEGLSETTEKRLWAAAIQNIKDHPVRYLVSTIGRFFRFSLALVVMIYGAGAYFLIGAMRKSWKEPGASALGIMLIYFLLIHSPMAVTNRYLLPIMSVAFTLVAAGLAAEAGGGAGRELCFAPASIVLTEKAWLCAQVVGVGLFALSLSVIARELRSFPAQPEPAVGLTSRPGSTDPLSESGRTVILLTSGVN